MSDVAVEFGATTLLRDVTFTVAAGERWGIVGRNGAGKTTLFRLDDRRGEPTRGAIAKRPTAPHRDARPASATSAAAATVWDAAATGVSRGDRARSSPWHSRSSAWPSWANRVTEADLARYGRDQERFAHEGGYEFHARVDTVLQGLGFDAEESKTRQLVGLEWR